MDNDFFPTIVRLDTGKIICIIPARMHSYVLRAFFFTGFEISFIAFKYNLESLNFICFTID